MDSIAKNKTSNKQQAFNLFDNYRREFLDHCRWVAVRVAKKNGGYVNIDKVREQVTTPDNVDPRVYGAVFNTSDFEKTGYTQTTRKTSHGRPIAIFYWKKYGRDPVRNERESRASLKNRRHSQYKNLQLDF